MTKNEFIIKAVMDFNKNDHVHPDCSVDLAYDQAEQLIERGFIFDEEIEEEEDSNFSDDPYINNIIGGI